MRLGGSFDYEAKVARLKDIDKQLEDPQIWEQHDQIQKLNQERVQVATPIDQFDKLAYQLNEVNALILLGGEEQDEALLKEAESELQQVEAVIAEWEFRRLFRGKMDAHCAYVEIQSGSGGTEAQDWAEMLLRLYLRWGERRGFQTTLTELSQGEVAGIKSATIYFQGDYAYGWLRPETGVHRLVRPSPFDSNQRRHTSFAAVFVSPEVDDEVELDIQPSDLRIDTYRASGAGGQHVQKTDSAVRITHVPSGIVVQCQNDRSQHRNREQAMRQLRAKLYELKQQEKRAEQQALASEKRVIGWGSQIRSYVLDDNRIKDLRTGVEVGNVQAVLDGHIDMFLKASLEAGL
jgi:peptide chain release factor 2